MNESDRTSIHEAM